MSMRAGASRFNVTAHSSTVPSIVATLVLVHGAHAQERPATGTLTALEREAAERCAAASAADSSASAGPGVLLGRVVDSSSGDPVPDALVWVGTADETHPGGWFETSREGVVLLCGLPAAGEVHLQASAPGRVSDRVIVDSLGSAVAFRDLLVSPLGPAERADAPLEGGVLQGVVRGGESGDGLAGAVVEVLGTGSLATTNERGHFIFLDVPAGRHTVVTRYLGRTSDTVHVELEPGALRNLVVLTLETAPVALPELEVRIERWTSPRLAGFYRRVDRGAGHYITRADLERTDVVGNFRRIPGVRVLPIRGVDYAVRLSRGSGLDAGGCPPLLYWNGALMTSPSAEPEWEAAGMGAFQRLQDYPRDLLEGIEVYKTPATAPAQYRMLGDICGIILVWTRDRRR